MWGDEEKEAIGSSIIASHITRSFAVCGRDLLCQNAVICAHASSTTGLPAGKGGEREAMATSLCRGCCQAFVSVSAFDAHRLGSFSCQQCRYVTGRRTRTSSPQERLLIHRDARWFSSWQAAQRARKERERGDDLMPRRGHNTTPGRTHDDIPERQGESHDRSPCVSAS
jgi:hypothetical protein